MMTLITKTIVAMVIILQTLFPNMEFHKEINMENGYNTENLSMYQVPEWYRDAKFGIFIHYGVYSVPAYGDEWYGNHMYVPGSNTYGGDSIYDHHLATYGGAKNFGYKDFIPEFAENLEVFKENNMAENWVDLFHKAGAKFVMPVGIHHDSFALYDSDIQTTYNSINYGGIDYVGELQKACKEKDIKFGISNHFVENDWFFNDDYAEGTDLGEKNPDGSLVYGELYGDGKSKSYEHIKKWYNISMEIIDKYHPDMIYYDFDLNNEALNKYDDANRYLMLANYYNQAMENNPEGVVCCNKHNAFTMAEALADKERSSLSEISPTPWQTDTSVGKKSWGYITDEIYRDGNQFIGALVDIVSKNGNLLLNIGPRADGTIPEEAENALLTIGNWLSTYGDAIYESRPWIIYGEGPSENTGDSFEYAKGDIRFTRNKANDTLYITSLVGINDGTLTVTTLKDGEWDADKIESLSLINGDERIALDWKQTDKGLEISVPESVADTAFAVEVKFEGAIPSVATSAYKSTLITTAVETENVSLGNSTADGSPTAVADVKNASVKFTLDFENTQPGAMWMNVSGDSIGRVKVYNDDTGELIAQFDFLKKSKEDYRTVTADIEKVSAMGKVNIRIEMTKGIEFTSFGFSRKKVYNTMIDATDFDVKTGNVKAELSTDAEYGGNNLGYVTSGDTVLYKNVDFGKRCSKLYLRAAADNRKIKVYIDCISPLNLIATETITTGSYNNYETICTNIRPVFGTHDVYIVFEDGDINLNWFCVAEKNFNL